MCTRRSLNIITKNDYNNYEILRYVVMSNDCDNEQLIICYLYTTIH